MKGIIQTLLLVVTFCMATTALSAQQEQPNYLGKAVIGAGSQLYPTGIIPSVYYDLPVSKAAHLHFRLGYQLIDHGDLGVQDDETGAGYGFSIGYKRSLGLWSDRLSIMLKNDVWFNTIDWQDFETPATGTTEIVVIQPTLQLDYNLPLGESLVLTPSLAFGLEWNVATEGRPTGEGPILLAGLTLGYILNN